MGPKRIQFTGDYKKDGLIPVKYHRFGNLIWIGLSVLLCGLPILGMAQEQTPPPAALTSPNPELRGLQLPGSIIGAVVDPSGAAVSRAQVKLVCEDSSGNQEVQSNDDGQFTVGNIPPGKFQLTISAEGFATKVFSGILQPAETFNTPQIELALATKSIDLKVEITAAEIANQQVKDEEQQRVLGFIPNFFVTYVPNAVPLKSKQKFALTWKSIIDPTTFVFSAALAGGQQARNDFSGYGQGAQGYAKRFGASYADLATSTFLGNAILPSLLKQDPRYFYKGSGSIRSRIAYAVANSVICKGDNGRWQPSYSEILGDIAAGGLTNLYYPASDRGKPELTFENAAYKIAITAGTNLLQEFLIRKLTSKGVFHRKATP
jgi:hypothetical protein